MNIAIRATLGLLSLYKKMVSPVLPPSCRFYPSCSTYAAQAVERHGLLHGGVYSLKRICRCHPWHEGGFDPVPERVNDGKS